MTKRVILVDPSDAAREMVGRRLTAQGYCVEEAADPSTGADLALRAPPDALIADLWMPGISGLQLCRLLRSEPATAEVVVVLCGDADERRDRFWAERAGANAYISKHRTGDLVRALATAIRSKPPSDDFFFQLSGGSLEIRDRIARHLDTALFESVIASEVRALATCETFERLFDLFSQFMSQMSRYRWLAVSTDNPGRLAVHHHPTLRDSVEAEVRATLRLPEGTVLVRIEDEDAFDGPHCASAIVRKLPFGSQSVGEIAISPCSEEAEASIAEVLSLVARDLGGPIRMTSLIEESQRLASVDGLTGIMNRRALTAALEIEVSRSQRHGYPLCLLLLDVDHFKLINDRTGHAGGDSVLVALGALLRSGALRRTDLAGRWGGEEFVIALVSTSEEGATIAAERIRIAIETMIVADDKGQSIPVTASIGLAAMQPGEKLDELIERADKAMYASKSGGRNRVSLSPRDREPVEPSKILETGRIPTHGFVRSS